MTIGMATRRVQASNVVPMPVVRVRGPWVSMSQLAEPRISLGLWVCAELLNADVAAVILAVLVYIYMLVCCDGYKGQLTLSSASLLFGGPGNPVIPRLIAAKIADESLIKNAGWINVDPAQCLITIAKRHNVSIQLDHSIRSAPLLRMDKLNDSHYGQCNALCSSAKFDVNCAVHYVAPSKILDQYLKILSPKPNASFAAMGDYFLLYEDVLTEYRATSGNARIMYFDHTVTTVSSAFFGFSSTFQCDGQPCVVFDGYTTIMPRAHVASDGQVVVGYSVPWEGNDILTPVCTDTFSPAEAKHRAEIGLTELSKQSSCRTIDINARDGSVFMTAYPTDYLGDHVLVDSTGHRMTIEPQNQQSTLEYVTATMLGEVGWSGVQHSHILRDGQLEFVSQRMDNVILVKSSMVPNFAAIVLQLAVYYAITYGCVLRGVRTKQSVYIGLSDVVSRSAINYVFLVQSAIGCYSATGVLAWVGPAYQQVIPWGATAKELLPLHGLTLLSVLQFYITSACGRAVIRRNVSRNVIRTRPYAFAQDAAVCVVAVAAVIVGIAMTTTGSYISPRHEGDEEYSSRIDFSLVVCVNVVPHVCIELLTRMVAVETKIRKTERPLNTFEKYCVGTRIEDVVVVLHFRGVDISQERLRDCVLVTSKDHVLVRKEVVALLGYVYVRDGLVRVRDVVPCMVMAWGGGILNHDNQFSITFWRAHHLEHRVNGARSLTVGPGCHVFRPPSRSARRLIGDIGGNG